MVNMVYVNRWTIGQWEFVEIDGGSISRDWAGRPLFGFTCPGETSKVNEWFFSIEHAMAAAIAEKYTGPRGAGGTGVGTAADWFMRMIGAGGPAGGRGQGVPSGPPPGPAVAALDRFLDDLYGVSPTVVVGYDGGVPVCRHGDDAAACQLRHDL